MERKTVTKWFWVWQFEKEEEWLNEMAANGWVLESVGFCRYTFVRCEPGTYSVRITKKSGAERTVDICTISPVYDSLLRGDADGDGKITRDDLSELLDYLLTKSDTVKFPAAADCNGDGILNAADLTLLRRMLESDAKS